MSDNQRLQEIAKEIAELNQLSAEHYEAGRNLECITLCDKGAKLIYEQLKLEHKLGLIKNWKPNATI